MSKAYKMAIAMIAADEVDWRALGIRLAQEAPEVFVVLAGGRPSGEVGVNEGSKAVTELHKAIWPSIDAGMMVDAIKTCRTITGWGLKESKDYCDALRVAGSGIRPPLPTYPATWTGVSKALSATPYIPTTLPPLGEELPTLKDLLDDLLGKSDGSTDQPKSKVESMF